MILDLALVEHIFDPGRQLNPVISLEFAHPPWQGVLDALLLHPGTLGDRLVRKSRGHQGSDLNFASRQVVQTERLLLWQSSTSRPLGQFASFFDQVESSVGVAYESVALR